MNAYGLTCYDRLGVRLRDLGCVMLDLEPVSPLPTIPAEWLYHSTDPDLSHVAGQITRHHTTLLFGLLRNAHEYLLAIDEVLADWDTPPALEAARWATFASAKPGEPYACIVAELESNYLRDAHARLSLLPHIDTHREYRPHVTLAYVHRNHAAATLALLDDALPLRFRPLGLNYGHQPPGDTE